MGALKSYFFNPFSRMGFLFDFWPQIHVKEVLGNLVECLCVILTAPKIEKTIKDMNPLKTPGLDVAHVVLYQK